VIGTNPVDSTVKSVAAVERALKDVVDTFGLQDTIPWCVLAHIDVLSRLGNGAGNRHPTMPSTIFISKPMSGTRTADETSKSLSA
jgi:ethanolamine ammonia-lyase large subunit